MECVLPTVPLAPHGHVRPLSVMASEYHIQIVCINAGTLDFDHQQYCAQEKKVNFED